MSTTLTPPDAQQCQARKPGNGPFSMGGEIGDPNDGYRIRCEAAPTMIVTEREPGEDGQRGSMSLCDDCYEVTKKQLGPEAVTVERIGPTDTLLAATQRALAQAEKAAVEYYDIAADLDAGGDIVEEDEEIERYRESLKKNERG